MWRRRWPTTSAPILVLMMGVLSTLPGTLTAPTEDLSLEDTARVLRHFSAGVGTRRGAGFHGTLRGRQSLQARLDSLEDNDSSREFPSRPDQHGNDLPSLERESLEVTLGSSAVPAGGITGSQGFNSQYFVVGDDDDDSLEIDEDDFRFMNLGRRYHPDGISPTSPQQLFIPQPAKGRALSPMGPAAPKFAPSLNNPYIIATASSSEENDEDNPYEDDDDDDLALYLSKNLLSVKGDDSSEERLELDDALLGKRYNFIDGQGSQRWGYELVDQYQHQTVNTDGTMNGKFGWTAPNGQEIKVQYIADDGGYRLVSTSGIHPTDNEDVRQLKIEHSQIHKKVASRLPVAPLPMSPGVPLPPVSPGISLSHGKPGVPLPPISSGSPGVPLLPTDQSYKVTIPFGGVGVSLPDPQHESPFQGSPGFSGVGIPLPPHKGSSGAVGVPLPPHTRDETEGVSFSIPSRQPTGGVPLPSPSGPGAKPSRPGFFNEDDEVVAFNGGSVGIPLPTQTGAGSGGVSHSIPSGQNTGGVPLPSPSGPGVKPSRPDLFGDDTMGVRGSGGVGLPGMSGVGTNGISLSRPTGPMSGGVPLPSPSGVGGTSSGSGFFGDDTVVVGTGGGVGLPGGTGGSFSSPVRPGTGGVPLPSPSGPAGTPSGPGFLGDDETVVAGGGVGLPVRPGGSFSSSVGPSTGGVPLPSPSGPAATPSGPGFFGNDDTVAGGGVGLPGGPGGSFSSPVGPGTGGVPLPSPSGPAPTPSGPGFFGNDDTVAGGGVGLPGGPGGSFSSPVGPGTGGVPLPSPSGPPATPSGPGFFGNDETVAGGGVGLPEGPGGSFSSPVGPGTGGVPLPSPSGPPATPSGPGFFGNDDTVAGGGVGLPGGPGGSFSSPVGPGTGGVPLPSPSGPAATPSGPGFFGNDETVAGGGVGLPEGPGGSFSSPVGPGTGGVPLPSPFGPEATPSGPGFFGDDDSVVAGGGVGLPGASGVGMSEVSLSSPTGSTSIGVVLPSPSEFEPAPSRPGFFGDDETLGFKGASGAGLPGIQGIKDGGVPLPSLSGSGTAPGSGFLGHDDSIVTGAAADVGVPEIPGAGTSRVSLSSPVRPEIGGVPLPSPTGPAATPSGPGFFGGDDTVVSGSGVGLPETPGLGTSEISFSSSVGLETGGVPLSSPFGPETTSLDDTVGGSPGFDDISTGFGTSGSEVGASGVGFGAGSGVSLPGFGSSDKDAAGSSGFDSTSDFGASRPGQGASRPGFGAGSGVSLPGFGSSDDDAAGNQGFDSTSGFGASRPGQGASRPGFAAGSGVSLPGFGSPDDDAAGNQGFDSISGFDASRPGQGVSRPGFAAGSGVSLPGFGSIDDDAAGNQGFDSTSGFGAFGPGQGASRPSFGAGSGVSLPESGSHDKDGAGSSGFGSASSFGASGTGLEASGPGFGAGLPGFDDSASSFGASSSGFNGEGVPLSVFGSTDNGRPVSPGFGFSGTIGSSDGFGQGSGGFGLQGGVPLDSGFGGSTGFNGPPEIASPEFGRGVLDASEVPLQGPPVPGTFSLSANLGQETSSRGVPLSSGKDMSFHHSHGSSQFFEIGPPEPVHQAAGGPTNASPFSFHNQGHILDSHRPNHFHSSSGSVREHGSPAESSANFASEADKPQDLVKVYHDIYGIKMRSEDWAAPKRREVHPIY